LKTLPAPLTQQFLLRLHAGDTLPDTLAKHLRDHQVAGGWLRLTGVLADVELRAFSAEIEGQGGTKRIAGPVQAVILDGSVGVASGAVSLDLRVVLARETDRGLETIAGELVRARVLGLDGSMTVFEDTVVPRALDQSAGVWLLRDDGVVTVASGAPAARAATHAASPPVAPAPRPSVPAVPMPVASSPAVPAPAASSPDAVAQARPLAPPPRVADDDGEDEESPTPQAGAYVEHFAFGPCEVLKSDGDRLHLRMKDGRIREIALEMLRVTPMPAEGGTPRFRLARKV
jgi:predicted DNA-binding protein with PD1-like motif